MKKSIFAMITFLVISMSSASAQVVWGVRVGASKPTLTVSASGGSSSVSMSVDEMFGIEEKFGIEIGPTVYRGLGNNFYLNSGLMFSIKSFDYQEGTLNMNYLEVPLYLGYAIPLGGVQPYVQVGYYIGYKFNESEESDMKDFNYGLGFMGGINIKHFKIEAGYQLGLANIWDGDVYYGNIELEARLSSLFLGVSYVF